MFGLVFMLPTLENWKHDFRWFHVVLNYSMPSLPVPYYVMCLNHWCYLCFFFFWRPIRPLQAALRCIRKAIESQNLISRPKIVVVSDTPSLIKSIVPNISEFAEVIFQFILAYDSHAHVGVWIFLEIHTYATLNA